MHPSSTTRRRARLLIGLVAVLLILFAVFKPATSPPPTSGPPSRDGSDGLPHVEISPDGKGLPDTAHWMGAPPKGTSAFLFRGIVPEGGQDFSDVQDLVVYVYEEDAERMRKGLLPRFVPLAIYTERPGSPGYDLFDQGGIPVGPKQKVPGLGTATLNPAGYQAVIKPRDEDAYVVVNSGELKGPFKLQRALKRLRSAK